MKTAETSGAITCCSKGQTPEFILIYYTQALEMARGRGDLRINSFIQLRKQFENGRPMLDVANVGDAETLLSNETFFRRKARSFDVRDEFIGAEDWGGWLGRYQARLASAMLIRRLDSPIAHER